MQIVKLLFLLTLTVLNGSFVLLLLLLKWFRFYILEHLTKNEKPGRSKKKKLTPGLTWLSILYSISAFVAVFEEITFNFLHRIFERKKENVPFSMLHFKP